MKQKYGYLIHTWTNKVVKDTVVNGYFIFDTTLTVPLSSNQRLKLDPNWWDLSMWFTGLIFD